MPEPTGEDRIAEAYADLNQYGSQITDADAPYNPAALAVVNAANTIRDAHDALSLLVGQLAVDVSDQSKRAREAEDALSAVRQYLADYNRDLIARRDEAFRFDRKDYAWGLEDAAKGLAPVTPLFRTTTTDDIAPGRDPLTVLSVNELASCADDEPVTVEGEVRRIEHRCNQAGAAMVTLTLADLNNDEITAKVDLYPAVYAAVTEERQQAGLPPLAVGDHIMARGATACRTSLDAYAVRLVTDWDGDTDPAVYTTNPPSYAAPPFTPSRSSQFLAGLRNGWQWGGVR